MGILLSLPASPRELAADASSPNGASMGVMTKTEAPEPLRLPENAVDVTAQHIGTTIMLVGARPQHPSPEAKVTGAPTGPGTAPPEEEDPAS